MRYFLTYLLCAVFAFAASPVPFNPQIRTVVSGGGGSGGTIGPISVAANGDDGEIWTSFFWSNGENGDGIGHMYFADANRVYCFYRFILPSGITAGATITSATLEIWGEGTTTWNQGVDDLRVRGTDSANASAPTAGSQRLNESGEGGSTPATTAVVNWDNVTWTTDAYNSVAVTTIIQELVTDNSGLSSSAGIVLWVSGITDSHHVLGQLKEYAVGGEDNVARLTIVWTP